ncbi:MAG TPA: hypothetical protein VLV85_13110 [Stellaceae bacterium]|jgi:hypothetical protein|nr:hypothetical protein [Stellaceae bacterium]
MTMRPTARDLRGRARDLRRRAEAVLHDEIRAQLLELADYYDGMAEDLEPLPRAAIRQLTGA